MCCGSAPSLSSQISSSFKDDNADYIHGSDDDEDHHRAHDDEDDDEDGGGHHTMKTAKSAMLQC